MLSERLWSLCIIDGGLALQKNSNPEVKALVRWLKSALVDQDTINKVNSTEALPFFFFPLPRLLVLLTPAHC